MISPSSLLRITETRSRPWENPDPTPAASAVVTGGTTNAPAEHLLRQDGNGRPAPLPDAVAGSSWALKKR